MTLSIDGTDISGMIETAAAVGGIVAILMVGLLVYLMVRPPRHLRRRRKVETKAETDPAETEQLWRLVDRMESRLEVLKRALADQTERRAIRAEETEQAFAPAGDDRDSGRKE